MAKSKGGGGNSANRMNKQANEKLADIHTAAKSLAGPRSYEKAGYPAYPQTLHINKGVSKRARVAGSD
jgi:hypothetical protein